MNNKFKMPTKATLKQRFSTINNAFAISITPFIKPTEKELETYYTELGIKEGQCAYCLKEGNEMDHLKPLVKDKMPTGYITDIHNLVPCCQRCNTSKGAKEFTEWYKTDDNIERLKKSGLSESQINDRYEKIKNYIDKIGEPLDYESIVGKEKWKEYIDRKEILLKIMEYDQKFCDELCNDIMKELKRRSGEEIEKI